MVSGIALRIIIGLAFTSRVLPAQGETARSVYEQVAAAFQQGKFTEAEQTLRASLREHRGEARLLGLMGVILDAQKRYDEAERYYRQAVQAAPRSAELLNNLGNHYLARGDRGRARAAYRKVVALEPHHPNANLCLAQLSVTSEHGVAALGYLNRLPNQEKTKPAVELLRAQALALSGRGSDGEALLKEVEKQGHGDTRVAFSVGMVYVSWKRYDDAEKAFKHALETDPANLDVLYNLGLAATRAGHLNLAYETFEKALRQRPDDPELIGAVARARAERQAQTLSGLRKAANASPRDPSLKAKLGKALFENGQTDEALRNFRDLLTLTSDPKILADSGRTLLEVEQYSLARELFERLVTAEPSSSEARLDLAISSFQASGPEAGLHELDKIPEENRRGDYFLLRAQILDKMGRFEEAVGELNRSFRAAPTRPDLYLQAALFLIKHERYREARELLEQATQLIPDSPELLLTQAITLELLQQPDETLLRRIETRWPEWSQPFLVHGIMLEIHLRSAEAKPLIERAIALGAHEAAAYYYLASTLTHATPDDTGSAHKAIEQALRLDPEDAYIRSLAGKIAYMRKDYRAALEHLKAATRLWPDMVEARETLSATYRALGDKEKSVAELQEVVRIKQANRRADQSPPFPIGNVLFTVRPPLRPPS